MSLQMILGKAGSGKSTYLYNKIIEEAAKNPKQTYLVLVPEQFTLSTQQEFVFRSSKQCIMNIDVLSFERLAYRVFEELGIENKTVLDDIGKTLLIRRIVREHGKELKVLKRNIDRPGYLDQVKSLLTEFSQYHVKEEELTRTLEQLEEGLLYYKLKDLTMIYKEFNSIIRDKYQTPEGLLMLLHDVAHKSTLLKDAVVCFDGYTGFTPVQRVFLEALLPMVKTMYVTVLVDPKEEYFKPGQPHELFYLSKKYIQSLIRLANQTGTEILDPVIMQEPGERRFKNHPGLAALEKSIFQKKCQPYVEKQQDVQIAELLSPEKEATFVASRIYHYRQKGLRYQEMAVVTANPELYGEVLSREFERAGFPFFLDQKKKVTLNAFVEVVEGLLEMIEEDFSYEGVFRYLKTGFSNLNEEQVEKLENYCLAARVRGGKSYSMPFAYQPYGFEAEELYEINEIREEFLAPLHSLMGARKAENTVRMRAEALFTCLEALKMEDKLEEFSQSLMEKGEKQKAMEYAAIYSGVVQMFERYVALMGEETMAFNEFRKLVEAGLEATKVATIPAGRDCIIIGDIERTRLAHIKVLFFVGVSEGTLPRISTGSICLNQKERETLDQMDIELAAGPKERLFVEQFYLYMVMAKAEQKLILTYPTQTLTGEGKNPAYLIGAIREILPETEILKADSLPSMEQYFHEKAALSYLLEHRQEAKSQEISAYLKKEPEFAGQFALFATAFGEKEEDSLETSQVTELFGEEISGSVSRLETFAGCRRRHFLEYGLLLSERNTGKLTMIDVGTIFHGAMERYVRSMKEQGYQPDTIPVPLRDKLVEKAVLDEVAELNQTYLYENARNNYQIHRLTTIVKRAAWAMGKQAKTGGFVPDKLEKKFLFTADKEQILKLQKDFRMKLKGKIDRIDIKTEGDSCRYRVIDYKSGNKELNINQVLSGEQLQLLTYAYAAKKLLNKEQEKPLVLDGVYYYHLKDPLVEAKGTDTDEEIDKKLFDELRLTGAGGEDDSVKKSSREFGEEELHLMEEYTLHKLQSLGNELVEGKLSPNPVKRKDALTCDYCPYRTSCGFEEEGQADKVRLLTEEKPEEVLQKMKDTLEKGV